MNRRRLLVATALIAGALSLSPGRAQAWEPIASSRPVWCGAAPYAMNSAGSADLGAAQSEEIVRQGMDDWTRVSCTSLTTDYRGTTGARPGTYEGSSVIGWVESGWRHDSNAIGVTGPRWGRSCIVEADMELNGVNYTWITGSGRGGSVNAYSIVLHEGGHYFGLGHSSDSSASMYFAYRGGVSTLNADDEEGICTLYPGDGTPEDCTTTGCPADSECIDGRCQRSSGDGSVCSPCNSSADCGGANDFCLSYPDGSGYCGRACSGPGDCGTGQVCQSISGAGSQCIGVVDGAPSCDGTAEPPGCRNDSDCGDAERCDASSGECEPRPTDGAELGDPCATDEECNSGVCFVGSAGGVCTRTCDWLDTTSCPGGFFCDGDATGTCGTGLCLRGVAGALGLGEACGQDTDCESLMCARGTCARPCIPGGTAGCPDGYSCQVGAVEGCGACKTARGVGDRCDGNDDCASRICAVDGDVNFCTELCADGEDCPAGYSCEAVGDVSVCAPPAGGGGRSDRGGCGCVAAGADDPTGDGWAWLSLFLLVPLVRLRRRRSG